MEKQKQSKKPGDYLIGAGVVLGIIGLLLFLVTTGNSAGPKPGLLALPVVGFGMIVIGYLQRIAAK